MIKGDRPTEFEQITLHKNISIPSEIHAYSLAIEYMQHWFLSKFDKDFFKTVFVNGKHVFDDFRKFTKQDLIKREKPALAIIPTIDFDYNRDTLDLRLGGRDILTRPSSYFDDSIVKDSDNNIYLSMVLKQVQMNFSFRVRVGSRAEQIDLANFMRMAFRSGSTQSDRVDYDFHIPYEIILNIAKHAGFDVTKDKKGREVVQDISGFLKYLNAHSVSPILYKMRTINGNAEYFIRVEQMYTHISNLDALSLDDGEREGQLDNNFHIEMNCILKIPAPQYYYYYSRDELDIKFKKEKELAGLYEFVLSSPPEKNEEGWENYIMTEWTDSEKHIDTVCFKELLTNKEINTVIAHSIKTGISPRLFMDIKWFNDLEEVPVTIDWETYTINVNKDMRSEVSSIAIYVDLEYINGQLIIIGDLDNDNNRMSK